MTLLALLLMVGAAGKDTNFKDYDGKLRLKMTQILLFLLPPTSLCVCVCVTAAVPREEGRIIGGQDCEPHSRPYMASLNYGYHFCGGVLINRQWVLSVAHCWYK